MQSQLFGGYGSPLVSRGVHGFGDIPTSKTKVQKGTKAKKGKAKKQDSGEESFTQP